MPRGPAHVISFVRSSEMESQTLTEPWFIFGQNEMNKIRCPVVRQEALRVFDAVLSLQGSFAGNSAIDRRQLDTETAPTSCRSVGKNFFPP